MCIGMIILEPMHDWALSHLGQGFVSYHDFLWNEHTLITMDTRRVQFLCIPNSQNVYGTTSMIVKNWCIVTRHRSALFSFCHKNSHTNFKPNFLKQYQAIKRNSSNRAKLQQNEWPKNLIESQCKELPEPLGICGKLCSSTSHWSIWSLQSSIKLRTFTKVSG